MGIGNTTTSSAIASVLLDRPVEEMTGPGAGLSRQGISRKIQVIQQAIEKYELIGKNPLEVLATVGGFDIAGLCGVFIGGSVYRVPIVIDGFISATAALVAAKLYPETLDFMIASHRSKEPAVSEILNYLGLSPILDGNLCLGEGTGAVTLFPLLDMAWEVYRRMGTFSEYEIEAYRPL